MSVHSELKVTKVIHGIDCPKCGGELIPSGQKTMVVKIIKTLSLGVIKIKGYQCRTCSKSVQVF